MMPSEVRSDDPGAMHATTGRARRQLATRGSTPNREPWTDDARLEALVANIEPRLRGACAGMDRERFILLVRRIAAIKRRWEREGRAI
jgi:hypothetical protein